MKFKCSGCRKLGKFCQSNLLLAMTIVSVFVGLVLGFILRSFDLSDDVCLIINFPGEIFMQVLKMMILPLIFSSLISALAQMDAKESGQMSAITVLYYMTTATLATVLGISLVLLIHPGDPSTKHLWPDRSTEETKVSPLDTLLDLIRNMFPENILRASFERVQTTFTIVKPTFQKIKKNTTVESMSKVMKAVTSAQGTNILGVIVFCTGFGVVISQFGEKAKIVIDFFIILDAVIMRWVEALIWFAPIGIVCLIAGNLLELENISDTAHILFMYIVTVLLGFLIHTTVIMPGIYFLITRKNPWKFFKGVLQAVVTGFGTASSGAALPISMQCLEQKLNIDRRISRFVLPLGTTINMDGSALYEAVAVLFIAQLNNVHLSVAEIITVSVISTISSIGMGSVPAGLVSILVILSMVGLPVKDVPMLITVDWLIDRIRTAVNILGDGYAAGSVAHLLKSKLEASDRLNEFRAELKEDIDLLRSAANSSRVSFDTSIQSKGSLTGRLSRRDSLDYVIGAEKLTWRSSIFDIDTRRSGDISTRKYSVV
ncbi:hypothetical protein AB6A40_008261 [Gnathostoma spinigerum]|uniref:Amino acid transporter n=1 Tax=Gnathostoma spinigerum TaxID=75299 RepID=A0ABD6EQY4_9BILA